MLFPCDHCGCFVFVGTTTCPHCEAHVRPGTVTRTAAAALLAASVACTGGGDKDTSDTGSTDTPTDSYTDISIEPEYGVTVTDMFTDSSDSDTDADTDTDTDADTDTDTDADTDSDTDADTDTDTTETGTTETGGSGVTIEPLYGTTYTN